MPVRKATGQRRRRLLPIVARNGRSWRNAHRQDSHAGSLRPAIVNSTPDRIAGEGAAPTKTSLGIAFALISIACFSTMDALVKLESATYSVVQIILR